MLERLRPKPVILRAVLTAAHRLRRWPQSARWDLLAAGIPVRTQPGLR
jgi:hypothetical protein